jgi:hypothetical protein
MEENAKGKGKGETRRPSRAQDENQATPQLP